MTIRSLCKIILFVATAVGLASCGSAPRSGDSIKADAVYRAQEQTFRPMAN
ncbi:MAG: hypothetical protein KDN20_09650 [Verrucomicrobiae bacterium]|nr:hypothetical protein [Verrucomicrobiae bacterium]